MDEKQVSEKSGENPVVKQEGKPVAKPITNPIVKPSGAPSAKPITKPASNQSDQEFEHLVRICNADLDGNKQIVYGLTKIKGVNFMLANAICNLLNIDKKSKTGMMDKAVILKITEAVQNLKKLGIPDWMLNRRKDYETGENIHLLSSDLDFQKVGDIKRLMKIRCYRGTRHGSGLTSRGQKTKSNFRRTKTKNKGHSAIGVKRKKGKTGKV